MRRGDLVTIALQSDYGKPRPALIIQSDLFDAHPSVPILPVTSELRATPLFRIAVEPRTARASFPKSAKRCSRVSIAARRAVTRRATGWA
jgi:mRNA interferase MazF